MIHLISIMRNKLINCIFFLTVSFSLWNPKQSFIAQVENKSQKKLGRKHRISNSCKLVVLLYPASIWKPLYFASWKDQSPDHMG